MAPILKKVQPDQLLQIENNSLQIKFRSQEIWELLIRRDFQGKGIEAIEESKQNITSNINKDDSLVIQDSDNTTGIPEIWDNTGSIDFRNLYRQLEQAKQDNLDVASRRLRTNLKKINADKDSWKITQLSVDPQAAKSNARRKLAATAPIGSRLLHRTFRSAIDNGPSIFSPRNVQFASTHRISNIISDNKVIRAPKSTSSFKPYSPKPRNAYESILKRTISNSDLANSRIFPNERPVKRTVIQAHPPIPIAKSREIPTLSTKQRLFSKRQPSSPTNLNATKNFSPQPTIKRIITTRDTKNSTKRTPQLSPPLQTSQIPELTIDTDRNTTDSNITEVNNSQSQSSASNSANGPPKRVITRSRKPTSIFITKR